MVGNDPLRTLKNSSRLRVCQVTHRVLVGQHAAVDLMQTSSDVCVYLLVIGCGIREPVAELLCNGHSESNVPL